MNADRKFDDHTVAACAIKRKSAHGHSMEVRRLQ
jgi:hypothetical protein